MLAYLDTLIGFTVVLLGISLIITIQTQLVSAFLSHRGANLLWGLEQLFSNIDRTNLPAIAAQARSVAKEVLTHRLISDSSFSKWNGIRLVERFKLASAIRPDELVSILSHLATTGVYAGTAIGTQIQSLLGSQNPTAIRQISLATNTSAALAEVPLTNAVPLIQATVDTVRESAGNLESWFHAMMDRVAQRFAMQMRLWTILFASLFALITGLDSADLISRIYTNGDFRQSLTGAAVQVSQIAEKVLAGGSNAQDALNNATVALYTKAVSDALAETKASADTKPAGISSEETGRAWIDTNVKDSAQREAAKAALPLKVTAARKDLEQTALNLKSIIDRAEFPVVQIWWTGYGQFWYQHLPGVLATVALLSLGAPFWFNLLKQLTNLRPILAQRAGSDDGKS